MATSSCVLLGTKIDFHSDRTKDSVNLEYVVGTMNIAHRNTTRFNGTRGKGRGGKGTSRDAARPEK